MELLRRENRESAAEIETRLRAEDPAITTDPAAASELFVALAAAEQEVERLYARWAELESKTR